MKKSNVLLKAASALVIICLLVILVWAKSYATVTYNINNPIALAPWGTAGVNWGTIVLDPYGYSLDYYSGTYSQMSAAIPLGFDFTYFGSTYHELYVCGHGYVTFLPDQSCLPFYSAGYIPSASDGANGLIAGFWSELIPDSASTIQYATTGWTTHTFVLEFNDVPQGSGAPNATFQIKLSEGSNNIEVHCTSCDTGISYATQGIEDQSGSTAYYVDGRNSGIFDASMSAVQFSPSAVTYPTTTAYCGVNPCSDPTYFNTTKSVTLSCSDPGSDCASTYYCTAAVNSPTCDWASKTLYTGGSITVSASERLFFYSVDANNTEELSRPSIDFILDTAAPTTSSSPGSSFFKTGQTVNASLSCNDGSGSGCASTLYCTTPSGSCTPANSYFGPPNNGNPLSITTTTVLQFQSSDNAGNTESTKTATYTIDDTGPTTTASLPGTTYTNPITVSLNCDDGTGSGCASTSYCYGTSCSPSTPYSGSLTISDNTVLGFKSTDALGNVGGTSYESYTITTKTQNDILKDLYNSTNGASWTTKTGWTTGSECSWYGVTCNISGNVVSIDLHNNNLTGSLPPSLGGLTSLQTLNLNKNHITGGIPTQLGALSSSLQNLNLGDNSFTGSIPSTINNLTSLQTLDLGGNSLSGDIPTLSGLATNLTLLDLSRNSLTVTSGFSTVGLNSLTNLQTLNLGVNSLSDAFPTLSSLTKLVYLYLDSNQLTGAIPTWIDNLSLLQELDVSYNQLNSIPTQLGNISTLTYLDLSNNSFPSVPSEVNSLTNLTTLFIAGNGLHDADIPSLTGLTNLQALDMGVNNLTVFPSFLSSLVNLKYLYIDNNALYGSMPTTLWNTLSNLQYLDLYHNQLTDIPSQLTSRSTLVYLDLGYNQFSGAIPSAFGTLTNLTNLYLDGNMLQGSVPDLTTLTKLTSSAGLDLGYNALYTTDATLLAFLNSKQIGGDWQGTQTVAPTGIWQSAKTSTTVTLTWTPISFTENSGGYEVSYATSPGGTYTPFVTLTSNKGASSLTVTGLDTVSNTYYFKVRTKTNPITSPIDLNQNTVWSDYSSVASGDVTVTSSSSGNGSISPTPTVDVHYGWKQTFTLTPDADYMSGSVGGTCPAGTLNGNSYTTGPITGACTVIANFVLAPHTITAQVITLGSGSVLDGTITQSGFVSVPHGTDKTFTIAPGSSSIISDVIVDGVSMGAITTYTFYNVTADHTIYATFASNPLVKRLPASGPASYYSVIQDAYNAAASGDTIMVRDQSFTETLNFNRNISVTLKGGYDSSFTAPNYSTPTTVISSGTTMTFNSGTVAIDNIKIH